MRLIDANKLMQNGWHLVQTGESNRFLASKSLADVPTVDAVEVVRCEQCKCNDITDNDKRRGIVWCKKICRYMKVDGFCSEGERRTDG